MARLDVTMLVLHMTVIRGTRFEHSDKVHLFELASVGYKKTTHLFLSVCIHCKL